MKAGNSNDAIYKEVVIIGNGPSGIALSYLLAGNLPYVTSTSHPDEMLSVRLQTALNKPLIKQDLKLLSEGLEGRSNNPISLLLDALLHPCADIGLEIEPLVYFKKTNTQIDHIVLGKGPPGGSWHKMDPYILTLSLSNWMSLPGLKFVTRDSSEKRAFAYSVANYYQQYVEEMNLKNYFNNNCFVNRIKPIFEQQDDEHKSSCPISDAFNYIISKGHRKFKQNRCCKRSREFLCQGLNDKKLRPLIRVPLKVHRTVENEWEIETLDLNNGTIIKYRCRYLVLANGSNDLPNKLEFSQHKHDPHWLFHDLRSLEKHLDCDIKKENWRDPVLIVGAGLSAADAVIATRGRNIPVIHVFRSKTTNLNKHLPENMYPEYHKVHQMMQDGGSNYPLYTSFPEHNIIDLDESSHSVILMSNISGNIEKLQVSCVCVLIGSRPDLSFLPPDLNLAVKKELPIDCKTNTLSIDKMTHLVNGFDNLFAVGPLAGDNFVRFIPGGALAVVAELYRRNDVFF